MKRRCLDQVALLSVVLPLYIGSVIGLVVHGMGWLAALVSVFSVDVISIGWRGNRVALVSGSAWVGYAASVNWFHGLVACLLVVLWVCWSDVLLVRR